MVWLVRHADVFSSALNERSVNQNSGSEARDELADSPLRHTMGSLATDFSVGFFEGPPDAAFEVVSPGDTYTEIEEKTLQWLRAGVRVVLVVDPRTKTARAHRANSTTRVEDVIEIDDVIPGWRLSLAELFE
jgi:hypothetical protein